MKSILIEKNGDQTSCPSRQSREGKEKITRVDEKSGPPGRPAGLHGEKRRQALKEEKKGL